MRSIRSHVCSSLLAVVFASASVACGLFGSSTSTQTMLTSAETPAGEGTIRIGRGENGNTRLEVRVKHLAPPSRVAPTATVYVVWIQPANAGMQNVGALRVDEDLVGKLETVTPHRAFTLTVTPEANASVTVPTHTAVFTSAVNRAE